MAPRSRLDRAGLISRGRDAQRRPRRLEAQPLAEANEWLERYRQFWEASFEGLDAVLAELKARTEAPLEARAEDGQRVTKPEREETP